MANWEVGYGRLTVQTSGGQSDTFQTTGRQREFRPNNGWVYCNYLFFGWKCAKIYLYLENPMSTKIQFFYMEMHT